MPNRLDDVEDGSELRRGMPAAHLVYGVSQTVNSATYLFVKALVLAEPLQKNRNLMNVVFG